MKISELDPETLTQDQIARLLYNDLEDDGSQGDCIFVFGSKSGLKYRVPGAVTLYKQGRAPIILFTGGVTGMDSGLSEAQMMQEAALQAGVSAQDILLETQSTNTTENVIGSLFILQRALGLYRVQKILVVTTNFHMRRCYLTLSTYMPPWVRYTFCPVNDQTTRKDNWWQNEDGNRLAQTEARKLIHYVQEGILVDQEI